LSLRPASQRFLVIVPTATNHQEALALGRCHNWFHFWLKNIWLSYLSFLKDPFLQNGARNACPLQGVVTGSQRATRGRQHRCITSEVHVAEVFLSVHRPGAFCLLLLLTHNHVLLVGHFDFVPPNVTHFTGEETEAQRATIVRA
jgi:hypothetical protein